VGLPRGGVDGQLVVVVVVNGHRVVSGARAMREETGVVLRDLVWRCTRVLLGVGVA
jgi:hypothetical protein